jgi:hypothetical protein
MNQIQSAPCDLECRRCRSDHLPDLRGGTVRLRSTWTSAAVTVRGHMVAAASTVHCASGSTVHGRATPAGAAQKKFFCSECCQPFLRVVTARQRHDVYGPRCLRSTVYGVYGLRSVVPPPGAATIISFVLGVLRKTVACCRTAQSGHWSTVSTVNGVHGPRSTVHGPRCLRSTVYGVYGLRPMVSFVTPPPLLKRFCLLCSMFPSWSVCETASFTFCPLSPPRSMVSTVHGVHGPRCLWSTVYGPRSGRLCYSTGC